MTALAWLFAFALGLGAGLLLAGRNYHQGVRDTWGVVLELLDEIAEELDDWDPMLYAVRARLGDLARIEAPGVEEEAS